MTSLTTDAFDPAQVFSSVDHAIKIIHKQDSNLQALKEVVCANIEADEMGFAAELLKAYYPADASDDSRFRAQMQGLKDVSAAINGTETSPVVFSTDKESAVRTSSAPALKVFTGYLNYEGVRIQVDFQTSSDASASDTDAAFLSALSQRASIDYLEIGEASKDCAVSSGSVH